MENFRWEIISTWYSRNSGWSLQSSFNLYTGTALTEVNGHIAWIKTKSCETWPTGQITSDEQISLDRLAMKQNPCSEPRLNRSQSLAFSCGYIPFVNIHIHSLGPSFLASGLVGSRSRPVFHRSGPVAGGGFLPAGAHTGCAGTWTRWLKMVIYYY